MEFKQIDQYFQKLDQVPTGNISTRIEILQSAQQELQKLQQTVTRLENDFEQLQDRDSDAEMMETEPAKLSEPIDVENLLESLELRVNQYQTSENSLEQLFQQFSDIKTELSRAKLCIAQTEPSVVTVDTEGMSQPSSLGL